MTRDDMARATLDAAMESAGLEPPRSLTVAVTGRCNLSCEHCLVDAGPRGSDPHVAAATVVRLVSEFAALGGRELWITGGEPLLHPEWEDLLACCCAQPGFDRVVLQTNGALLGARQVRALRRLARDGFTMQVSLDGASARTHDAIRGSGAFARTMEGLSRLRAAGLADRVTVAFTEMGHNMGDVPALLELVRDLGLRRLVSGTLVADGRAAATGAAPPSPGDYGALLSRYRRDEAFRALYDAHGIIAAIEWWKGRLGEGADCCTLAEHPYVTAGGRIHPCALCRADAYAVPGAHDRPLAAALAEGIPTWAQLLDVKRRRHRALPECQQCPGLRHCGGGCAGRAHAAHGTFMAAEDRCDLRKAVYVWREEPSPRAEPSPTATR